MSDVIFSYSRAEALADGVLVDVSSLAVEAGIKYPVAMTSELYHSIVPDERAAASGQDLSGRLWDVFTIFKLSISKGSGGDRLDFNVIMQDSARKRRIVAVKSVCGPGDSGEPVITMMLPDQD